VHFPCSFLQNGHFVQVVPIWSPDVDYPAALTHIYDFNLNLACYRPYPPVKEQRLNNLEFFRCPRDFAIAKVSFWCLKFLSLPNRLNTSGKCSDGAILPFDCIQHSEHVILAIQ